MKTKLLVLSLTLLLSGCFVQKSPDVLKKDLSQKWKVNADSVSKTPIKGLYEVYTDGQIFYVDENLNYHIKGSLVAHFNNENVTLKRLGELYRLDISQLPKNQALKHIKGDGSRELYLFVDPRCSSCLRLEQLLSHLDNVTTYIFITPMLGDESIEMAKNILCSSDPTRVWNEWILEGKVPEKLKNCDETPIRENLALSKRLGFKAVPTLIFEDGSMLMGTVNFNVLEERLHKAHSQSDLKKVATDKRP